MKVILMYVLLFIAAIVISIGITIGLVKLACFCFGIKYSLKIAIGIWVVLLLVGGCFKQ